MRRRRQKEKVTRRKQGEPEVVNVGKIEIEREREREREREMGSKDIGGWKINKLTEVDGLVANFRCVLMHDKLGIHFRCAFAFL